MQISFLPMGDPSSGCCAVMVTPYSEPPAPILLSRFAQVRRAMGFRSTS